jgi:hypothetical protein
MEAVYQQLNGAIDAYVRQRLNNSSAIKQRPDHRIPYTVIAPFMTPDNLAALARQLSSGWMLTNLCRNVLRLEDRFLFMEDVLSAVEILPPPWRAKIWLECRNSSENWNPRERNGRVPYYNHREFNAEEMDGYVVTSKWLVDAPLIRKWYCRRSKPGSDVLRFINGLREMKYPLRDNLLPPIRKDDLPGFALLYAMSGVNAGWTLLKDVLTAGAHNIFKWLLENENDIFNSITPRNLMVFAAANLPDDSAINTIKTLEEKFPGTLASRDIFGNDLLWYSMHNNNIFWCCKQQGLAAFLIENGCRCDRPNHLNLTYDDICQIMSLTQKKSVGIRAGKHPRKTLSELQRNKG